MNVIGAIIYVIRASSGWRIPEEHGMIPVAGEPFVWGFAILPVVACFTLVNLLWAGLICFRRKWRDGYFMLMTAAVWLIAVWIDFAHH